MPDFGALPPEVNSGLMYAGPGSGPLLSAAAAWQTLAGELRSAAAMARTVLAGLGESWIGPSSATMAGAVAPYLAWIDGTAGRAEQAAVHAAAAAAAYQGAFAAMVAPAVIAANRSQLMALLASNIAGQNAAAIAAVEAGYTAMWAQDAAAMYHYAGTAAAAAAVRPFDPAPSSGSPDSPAASTGLAQLTADMPQLLQGLAAPAQGEDLLPVIALADILGVIPSALLPANVGIGSTGLGITLEAKRLTTMIEGAITASPSKVTTAGTPAPAVSAGPAGAGRIGQLSVPQSWAGAAPQGAGKSLAAGLPETAAAAGPAVEAEGTTALYGDVALATLAGASLATTGLRGGIASAMNGHAPDRLAQFVAELSAKPGSQVLQHWHTNPAELDGLLADLSKKPGIHAVHLKGAKPKNPPAPQPG